MIPEQSLVRITLWTITLRQTFRAIAGSQTNQSFRVSPKQEFTVTNVFIVLDNMTTYVSGKSERLLRSTSNTFDILKPLNINPQPKDSDRLHSLINFALSVPIMETRNGAG